MKSKKAQSAEAMLAAQEQEAREELREQVRRALETRTQGPVGALGYAGAALFCGQSRNHLGRAVAEGDCESFIVGNRRYFLVVDLIKYLQKCKARSEAGTPLKYHKGDGKPEALIPADKKCPQGRQPNPRPVAVLDADE